MKQYDVTGMSCAACSARVEKAVSAVEGVTSCSVNLLTNSMQVEGTAPPETIIQAVQNAGYGANEKGKVQTVSEPSAGMQEQKRLIASLILLIPLMYLTMGHMMWGFPIPAFLEGNHAGIGILEMLFSGIIMVINQKFFVNGFKGVIHCSSNMDTLVAMGSGVSFLWSVYILLHLSRAMADGDNMTAHQDMMNLYFESAGMIVTLITVGKMLEARSKGKTTDALKSLMKLAPETAVIEKDGKELTIPVSQLQKGDIFVVRAGESIPADGIVIEGHGAVNESALTGESIPVDKSVTDRVSGATINQSGFMRCQVTAIGEETALSQIIRMVSDATAGKAPIAKTADKVSGIFVPAVISIAVVTLIIWLFVGQSMGYALARAISVLVISCPCALGLATPVSIMVGNGVGAKNGILFKTAETLEETGKIQIVALDKTGTVTSGTPEVTDIFPIDMDEKQLLKIACSLEFMSEHPLSKAVMNCAQSQGITPETVTDFQALAGNGLTAKYQDLPLSAGNQQFIQTITDVSPEIQQKADAFSADGKTPLFFTWNQKLIGIIAVADVIREDSAEAIQQLRNLGIHTVMLTGDNERTARAIAKNAGIDNVIAGVMPDEKEFVIRELQKQGKTAMIGDGINDSPALTRADIGIAIGAGTDIAIDSADVVLMKSSLLDAVKAIRLSRGTLKNIHENLFWAFIYNLIGIPLAAGLFVPLFGWELNPMFGAAAMSLSSFCVVSNALRLNLIKLDASRDKPLKTALSELQPVQLPKRNFNYTMHIEGMMCPHCEKTVKKTLERFPEVVQAVVSWEQGTAMMSLNSPLQHLDEMQQAIVDKGYQVKV